VIGRNGLHRLALAALAAAGLSGGLGSAQAATVFAPVQPLGVPGDATKPDCASPFAPWNKSDMAAADLAMDPNSSTVRLAGQSDFMFSMLGLDLLPTATICSPTYSGLPAAFSGTTASRLPRSRVGRGWREIGNTFAEPAPLRPGDQLGIPEVDDAAQLRVAVTSGDDAPAAPVTFTDLSPGPSTVTVVRDARGVVARLTRADGSTSEGVAAVPVVPALNPSISGTARRWRIVTHQLPGTVVYANEFFEEEDGIGVAAADGRTVTVVDRGGRRRAGGDLILVTASRSAMRFQIQFCSVTGRKGRPVAMSCDPFGLSEFFAVAARATKAAGPVTTPAQAAARFSAGIRATAARAANAAPLTAVPVARSASMLRDPSHGGLVPLAADVNGDGRTDFWSEELSFSLGVSALTTTAGTVFVSGPGGLQPHRVQFSGPRNSAFEDDDFDSEISAIDDVTGDGIGELIVDLGERQAMIPGDRSWGEHGAPIITFDPADLDPGDRLLQPSSSSPGAPYAALDDVTGDGRRELGATDDFGTWQGISGSQIATGSVTRLSAIARAVPTPSALLRTRLFADTAPRFDPRGRVIAGQLVALSWPTIATRKAPTGKVTIAVRDALGRDVRPPATATVPGNALLLDYDRRSGDALLLAVTPQCTGWWRRDTAPRGCTQTVVRVRPDGSVRQTLAMSRASHSTPAAQTARFISDGPDADGDVDIILTQDGLELSAVESVKTGTVAARDFATAAPKLLSERRVGSSGLRFIAVVSPDGTRHVFVSLRPATGDRRPEGAIPTEIVWK
jgi:hypothetical protein